MAIIFVQPFPVIFAATRPRFAASGDLPDATVLPEIAYGHNQALSVDWIVITDDLVLLVEVTAARAGPT